MKHLALCLAALLVVPALQAASLEDLRWIAGHWVGRSAEESTEELWIEPSGGLMLGLGRTVRAKGRTSFEFLRIEESEGKIVYISKPQGKPPTPFPLKSIAGRRVTFENPEHDFPQRVIYWLDGAKLCARIEGTADGKESGEEWCWTKK